MKLLFCGVGALGSTAAWYCRNLDATLCLLDADRVESRNLLAQMYVKQSVGKNKAEALKLQLSNFHGVKAEACGVRLAEANAKTLCAGADLLIDCFDNAASRRLLTATARELGKPLVHAGISGDGTFGLVRWDERFEPDAEDRPGQPTCEGGEHLPLVGVLGATLARVVQDFLKTGKRRDAMITLESIQKTAES